MQIAIYAATLLLLGTSLLVANSPTEQIRACESLAAGVSTQPAQINRTIQLDELGIEVDIPENFRVTMPATNAVSIMPPGEYEYLQCMIETQAPTAPDALGVFLYQKEPTSEALIRSESGGRFGTQFLREEVIAGQQAFIYTRGGMTTSLIFHINYPDQETSLVIDTEIGNDNTVYMQETLDRILSTLRFL